MANNIVSEEKRRAILLHAVGASTLRLIRTLVSPQKLTDFSFKEIEKALEVALPTEAADKDSKRLTISNGDKVQSTHIGKVIDCLPLNTPGQPPPQIK